MDDQFAGVSMKTITLKIEDGIIDNFLWLLKHFENEIKILDQSEYISDDECSESIDSMAERTASSGL